MLLLLKLHLVLVFMLCLLPTCFSQSIKGVVCNSKKEALPFTNIALLKAGNSGTATDEQGAFELKYLSLDDSIKITNIAYQPRVMAVKSLLNHDTIFLTEAVKNLDQVMIKPRDLKEDDLGYLKYNHNASYALIPGSQVATFIPNKKYTGWVNGVYFKIKSKGDCKNNIRIRLMSTDPNRLAPAADLLRENVLVDATALKANNYIDLSKYNIPMPKEGIFVVVEWVAGGVKCDKNSYTILLGNTSIDQNMVWFNAHDNQWVRSGFHPTPNGNYMTPNVGVRVGYF
jgi:hypothetical protein